MITFQVNGRAANFEDDASTPLLWVLRDYLHLTGTKYGCGIARCGACTVHLDGEPIRSCVTPVSRAANRAVSGAGPGPEGAMTKLVLSEIGHDSAAIMTELNDFDSVFMDGAGGMSNMMVLMHRGMSIAGGTSEIKRNQIGERILGLPRDPLIK